MQSDLNGSQAMHSLSFLVHWVHCFPMLLFCCIFIFINKLSMTVRILLQRTKSQQVFQSERATYIHACLYMNTHEVCFMTQSQQTFHCALLQRKQNRFFSLHLSNFLFCSLCVSSTKVIYIMCFTLVINFNHFSTVNL